MARYRISTSLMAFHPEVTGSQILLSIQFPDKSTKTIVIDVGLFQEKDYDTLNHSLDVDPRNVDYLLVTHVHMDHVGRLPYYVKKGYSNSVYCTNDTAKMLKIALNDACRILNNEANVTKTKPLYGETDVSRTIEKVKGCNFNESILLDENISITFFENGHLPGAGLIFIEITYPYAEPVYFLFTGDYKQDNIFFDVHGLPEWLLDLPLTVVTEATYGDSDSTEKTETFSKNVSACIKNRGTVIVPAFSLQRAQEVMYAIKCMKEKGQIPQYIDVGLDGNLTHQYTNLYLNGEINIKEEMRDFLPENTIRLNKDNRMDFLNREDAKIVVTSSGMATYGPAQIYIPAYISKSNALIQFTGYTADGTLGSRLKNAEDGKPVLIGGVLKVKKARVEYSTEFSAHAKADELIKFLQKFRNLKFLVINHGQTKAKQRFAERCLAEVDAKDIAILDREYFFRIYSDGLGKQIPTKFK